MSKELTAAEIYGRFEEMYRVYMAVLKSCAGEMTQEEYEAERSVTRYNMRRISAELRTMQEDGFVQAYAATARTDEDVLAELTKEAPTGGYSEPAEFKAVPTGCRFADRSGLTWIKIAELYIQPGDHRNAVQLNGYDAGRIGSFEPLDVVFCNSAVSAAERGD